MVADRRGPLQYAGPTAPSGREQALCSGDARRGGKRHARDLGRLKPVFSSDIDCFFVSG